MSTDRIGRHEVLLPINHKNYNFVVIILTTTATNNNNYAFHEHMFFKKVIIKIFRAQIRMEIPSNTSKKELKFEAA